MIAELEDMRPMSDNMRVLDPACGSGAFLVQCYRRMIVRSVQHGGDSDKLPETLKTLLTTHLFGIDRDGDACQVAAMSLVLTLLDSIPTDVLQNHPDFKLPRLHGSNIFKDDFFDPDSTWAKSLRETRYDWILGNPPWVKLSPTHLRPIDKMALDWIQSAQRNLDHEQKPKEPQPVVGNQVAEAFAWKALSHVTSDGVVGLLVPAKTVFDENVEFRHAFVTQTDLCAVANFSNLREVLFPQERQTWRPAPEEAGRRTLSCRRILLPSSGTRSRRR